MLLKKIDPLIEGFQRPTLGSCGNFDVGGGEFIQILNTGAWQNCFFVEYVQLEMTAVDPV